MDIYHEIVLHTVNMKVKRCARIVNRRYNRDKDVGNYNIRPPHRLL